MITQIEVNTFIRLRVLLSAWRSPLFQALRSPLTCRDLSEKSGLEEAEILPLLALIEHIGLLRRSGDTWSWSMNLEESDLRDLVRQLASTDTWCSTALDQPQSFGALADKDVSRIAETLEADSPEARREIAGGLLSAAKIGPALAAAQRYLEVGAGTGLMLCSLLEALPALRATAIDRSPATLDGLARRAAHLRAADRVECIASDVVDLDTMSAAVA